MTTEISLPDELFARADKLARRTGRSRSELYADALREYLARHDEEAVTMRLNEVLSEVDASVPEAQRAATVRLLKDHTW